MKKIIYTLSAFMMACIISFSGVGGTYIYSHATSVGIPKPNVWNDDESVWDNILRHLKLYASFSGVYINPLSIAFNYQDFIDFMGDNGYSHDIVHGIFCDCDDETHTSFSGQEHGGGGFVRDGITTDEDGNVTYSDEVLDLFHGFILDYLDSNSGYVLFKTTKAKDIAPILYNDKTKADNFITTIDNLGLAYLFTGTKYKYSLSYVPSINISGGSSGNFVYTESSSVKQVKCEGFSVSARAIEEDWSRHDFYILKTSEGHYVNDFSKSYSLSDLTISTDYYSAGKLYYVEFSDYSYPIYIFMLVSSDGRCVKVWYDFDKYKQYDIGNQMYYVTDSFNNYDSTIDNSTTITSQEYAYYNDNSTTIYQTIQNNIDNSGNSDLTEKDVQDIVDAAVQEIKDSIANSGNDDNGGSDSGGSDDGGSGVGDLVDGIGKLLDTILSLIGKVMGVVADFTQSILDLFSGFTEFTDGFSNFLSGAFGFIPQEIWNVIQVGLSLMILLAVIKFLRK